MSCLFYAPWLLFADPSFVPEHQAATSRSSTCPSDLNLVYLEAKVELHESVATISSIICRVPCVCNMSWSCATCEWHDWLVCQMCHMTYLSVATMSYIICHVCAMWVGLVPHVSLEWHGSFIWHMCDRTRWCVRRARSTRAFGYRRTHTEYIYIYLYI